MNTTLTGLKPDMKQTGADRGMTSESTRPKNLGPLFATAPGHTSEEFVPKRAGGWDRRSVVRLTPYQINSMPSETLIEIVNQWNDRLPQPDVRYRLHYLDRNTLEQLVYLVRQSCRCQP